MIICSNGFCRLKKKAHWLVFEAVGSLKMSQFVFKNYVIYVVESVDALFVLSIFLPSSIDS